MRKLANFMNKYFYLILFFTMTIGFIANYHGSMMGGILNYYIDFARLIKSGFTINIENPTFPMWGYGFIFAITSNKVIILLLQFCITFLTMYVMDKFIQEKFKRNNIKTIFRLFLIFSFPWFSFNSILWPHSIVANFITLSLIFLYKSIKKYNYFYLILSACLFGILLNFRCDYYLFPLFLFGLIVIFKLYTIKNKISIKLKIHFIFLWVIIIYTFMIPYAIYTKTVTNHYLITSTNSGHVSFIGLGILPNNNWGITPYDGDPKMAKIMKEEFGQKSSACNLQYDGDRVLKRHFLNLIKKDPVEYTKKVFYSFYLMLKGGFYWGEYYNWVPLNINKAKNILANNRALFKNMKFIEIFKLLQKEGLLTPLFILQGLVAIYSIFLFIFFNLSLCLLLFKKLYRSNYFISIILISIIFYQYAICGFLYYSRNYITNLYLVYIFIIVWVINYYIERKDNQYDIIEDN